MSTIWSFTPLDSSFFREAKPFNAGEGGFLDSVFPPPVQTLIGAFRSAVGEAEEVDWNEYRSDANHPLREIIGTPDDLHPLSFGGPCLIKNGERLYPTPLHLLTAVNKGNGERQWARLEPGDPVTTDMGEVCLPKKVGDIEGGKSPEDLWLNADEFARVLQGGLPEAVVLKKELVEHESRTGIARNNKRGTVEEGMLYFTRHLRLMDGVTFGLKVDGLKAGVGPAITRLGGEGRVAALSNAKVPGVRAPKAQGGEKGLILTLVTHGDFGGDSAPDWHHQLLAGLSLQSACIGKPVREGGWDYHKRAPRPLISLVPAGSSYFVETDDIKAAIERLHGARIGNRTELGYGEIAVGLWK